MHYSLGEGLVGHEILPFESVGCIALVALLSYPPLLRPKHRLRLVAAPECRIVPGLLLELALKVCRKWSARGLLGDVLVIAKLIRHSLSIDSEIHAGLSQSVRFSKRLG